MDGHQICTIHRTTFVVPRRYEIISSIGYGGYGYAVRVRDTSTAAEPPGVCLALKKLDGALGKHDRAWGLARQLLLLKDVGHPNVLRVRDVLSHDKTHVYVVYEQLECNLAEVLRAREAITKSHIQHIVVHLARALKYLHQHNVVVVDLKPEGVQVGTTLAAQGNIRIADFNAVMMVGEPMPAVGPDGPSWYMAPEAVLRCTDTVATSMDMWSLGCLIVELFTARPLLAGSDYLHQLRLMADVVGAMEDVNWVTNKDTAALLRALPKMQPQPIRNIIPGADKAAVDLVKKLLHFNPAHRMTAADVLAHPFCADVDATMCPLPLKELGAPGMDWALAASAPLSALIEAVTNVATTV